jgi:lipid-binding SYLF domain-containing protein
MKKSIVCLLVVLMWSIATFAADDEREVDRVKDAGVVLKEILNIPDDIPQDLIDKAECVIILPSVKKGALGIGGSFGRGVMVCAAASTTTGGARLRCMRSKVSASDSRSAARPPTLFCSS